MMKKIQKTTELDGIKNKYLHEKTFDNFNQIFVDIETTGLSRSDDIIFLIGTMIIKNKKLILTQWFCEKRSDERKILMNFINNIDKNSHIITYNGNSFDIGFLNARLSKYNLPILDDKNLYTDMYTWAKLIDFEGIENKRLKTIEEHLNIHRIDGLDGPRLIRSYKLYWDSKDENILSNILLHNYEDVFNLYELWVLESMLDEDSKNWLSVTSSINQKFLYKFKLTDAQLYIIGIYDNSLIEKDIEIYKGNYLRFKGRYFEIKLNILTENFQISNKSKKAYLLNKYTIKNDLNLTIENSKALIKIENEIKTSNLEDLIENILKITI